MPSAPERSVIRVLSSSDHSSRPVIAGGLERPTRSHRAGHATPVWSCFGWGLPCPRRHRRGGALLPHRFTLTCFQAVCFLLHFPASHLDWPLASTLPCEARTFLSRRRVAAPPPAVTSPSPTSERANPTRSSERCPDRRTRDRS